ncbi:MAG TPA: STAS domain-containing protein [Terriglobia bacterium]|nr:STAS domain-containing protein [Terriglobia bacterium]
MKITVRTTEKATILDLDGPLKIGEAEQGFREKVKEVVGLGVKNLGVNLADVPTTDSSGIGAMMFTYTAVKRVSGKCKFFAPSKQVRQILKMVLLDTVFEIYDDEAAAMASF